MRIISILLFALLITGGRGFAQKVFKCQDESGGWIFSENPDSLPAPCREQIQKEAAEREEKKRKANMAGENEGSRKIVIPKKTGEQPAAEPAKECADLPTKLEKCEPYECVYTNSKGKPTKRAVKGLSGKDCKFEEEMTNRMALLCVYPEKDRKQAASYYKLVMGAKKVESKTIKDKDGKTRSVDVIDGKEMENPLASGINSGVCQMKVK